MRLSQQRCVACRPGAPAVTPAEADELRAQIPAWRLAVPADVPRLERVFQFTSEAAALRFVERLGALADDEDHHPALQTEGASVTVQWWTTAISNLHRNDFIMAANLSWRRRPISFT